MADTYTANIKLHTSVMQTLDTSSAPAAASPQINHTGWDFSHSLSASAAVPFTAHAVEQVALTDGSATIDLTATTGVNGEAVDGTGLKVQVLKLRNPSTNTNPITITPGAANGYDFRGASWSETLQPGDESLLYAPETADEIGATDKTFDLAGTGSEALDVEILMG